MLVCRRVRCVVCRGVELSVEQARCWYESRACEVEQLSGQVDGALELVRLAIDKSVQVCVHCAWLIFTTQHYASAICAVVMCPSVCLSDRPSTSQSRSAYVVHS